MQARGSTPMHVRALVLCAGYGSRLRPLTYFTPKPLLPVAGVSILERTLRRLAHAGCEAVAVNLFHQGEQIERALGADFEGMPLRFSHEEKRMGTLGAFTLLRDFFAPADVILLVNGDSLCHWPFKRLLRKHAKSGARATLLLVRRPDPAEYGGGVGVGGDGRLHSFMRGKDEDELEEVEKRHVFAGAHALDPALLDRVPDGPSNIVPTLYEPLLAEGELITTTSTGLRWHDLGTPDRYLEGALDWARGGGLERLWRRNWTAPGATVHPSAKLQSAVVEAGAVIEAEARVEGSLVLPGARVRSGSRLRDSIVGPEVEVPTGTRISDRLVTPQREAPVHERDTVLGKLVYTRLENDRASVKDGGLD